MVTLNNGVNIPQLGLGTWMIIGPKAEHAVTSALEIGYRHIDTARIYRNESRVGKAISASGMKREDVFITTKIFNTQHRDPVKALDDSLRRLGTDYVDLYLIHWPVKERLRTWKILEGELAKGKVKAIGVSNFTARHLEELIQNSNVVPAVNQVEFHPYLYQKVLLKYCQSKNIALEAYSPLAHGRRQENSTITSLSKKYKKTTAQIMIRWSLQLGNIVIPKSSHPARIKENFEVFDFSISDADMELIGALNEDLRTCWNPEQVV